METTTAKLKILSFLAFAHLLLVYPLTEYQSDEVGEYGDYFEGDMELDYDQMSAFLYSNKRNVLRDEKYRWPRGVVHYEIDDIFEEEHIAHIRKALDKIEEVTCIKFVPKKKHTKAYILVKVDPASCHSTVGYRGRKQLVNLRLSKPGYGCFKLGIIIHEFLHALGFYHQHSASDRDKFITIVEGNIKENKERNFLKYLAATVTDMGVSYDYSSIMHYGSTAFSKNGKPTIVPHDKTAKIGQREGLSKGDIKKINAMYKCHNL